MKLLEADKRVCVEIEKSRPEMSGNNFFVLGGTLKAVRAALGGSVIKRVKKR